MITTEQVRHWTSPVISTGHCRELLLSGALQACSTPPHIYIYTTRNRSFTSIQMCHTHTPCLWQGGATENEVKMRMRGKWRWDDLENEMKNYLTRTRRGERKRRRREHQHDTPDPERANPERAREKKSGGSTDTEQDQRRGGKDESAWTNLTKREPTHTSARDGADLPGEGRTHEIGDQWGLVGETQKLKQDSVPKYLEVVRCAPPGPCSGRAAMA